jgi:hypothetical protein
MQPDRIWWAAATVFAAAGLALLPFTSRPSPAAPAAVAIALILLAMSSTVRLAGGTPWPVALPRALGDALLAAVLVLGLQGWVGLVGPLAAAGAVVLLAGSSPPLVWWLRRTWRGRSAPAPTDRAPVREAPPAPTPLVGPEDVASMTTAAIGASWRRTARELPHTREPRRRAQLAELRRLYLDELERRDHDGFRSWLNAGPRAAHDPSGYIDPGAPPNLAY